MTGLTVTGGTRAAERAGAAATRGSGLGRAAPPREVRPRGPIFVAIALLVAGCAGPAPPTSVDPHADPIPPLVQTPPPVPRPEPGTPVETYSVSVEDVPVRELLFALARDAGIDMDIDPGIDRRITMNAANEPFARLLERIARQAELGVEDHGGVLVVRRDEPVLRTYAIDYVALARETETVNKVGTGVGSGIEAPAGEENGSAANVRATSAHRFWDTLVESVRGVIGETPGEASKVFAHRETSLLAVRTHPAGHREVARLLRRILASARRQVLIEATIVEVDLDDRFRGGVDFSRVFDGLEIETSLLGGNVATAPFARFSIPDLGVTVRLLGEFGDVRVLSTPLVMALNNQTAVVKIAENRVFFTSEVSTETSETSVERNVRTKLHTVPVGLILLVTPSVADDDEIILKIRPTVTRETGFALDPNPELAAAGVVSRIPEIAVREIESVLRLRSGEVAVLGGLMREESREDTTGVPLLHRLPGIGAAFRYRDRKREKTELIVFLRPTVVREPDIARDLGRFRRWWPVESGPVPLDTGPGASRRAAAPGLAPAPVAIGTGGPYGSGAGGSGITRDRVASPDDREIEAAWAALRRGDHRRARAGYLAVLEARPEDALPALAAIALREGRRGEARAWYRRLAMLVPDHEAGETMALVLGRNARPEAREREIASRLARRPDAPWLQVAIGNARAAQEKWDEAANAYRSARRLAPESPDPTYNLAVVADRRGPPATALERYRDALDLAAASPPSFDVHAVRERIAALARKIGERP